MTVLEQVLAAEYPEDLFGTDDENARREYRRLAAVLHPDVAGPDATVAFQKLSELYEWHRTGTKPKGANQIILTTKKRSYVLGDLKYQGDVANLYGGVFDDEGTPAQVLLKMPRDPNDNDLLVAEAQALKVIRDDVDDKWAAFFPYLVESFRHQDKATNQRRRVNAIAPLDGFYTLAEVLKAYPDGIDSRDVAWMWRRLLTALGVAHDAGLVHGAPTLDNILIHPEKHGLVLADWCYSVKEGEPLTAVPESNKAAYPLADITDKAPVTGALDMFVAHRTILRLLRRGAPKQYVAFIAGVSQARPKTRPTAGETLKALDEMLFNLYGPRKYHSFTMPA